MLLFPNFLLTNWTKFNKLTGKNRAMKIVNVHETKTNLSAILKDIEKGEHYLICRNGKPVAELVPHEKKQRSRIDPHLSNITVQYDPREELTSEEWGDVT